MLHYLTQSVKECGVCSRVVSTSGEGWDVGGRNRFKYGRAVLRRRVSLIKKKVWRVISVVEIQALGHGQL